VKNRVATGGKNIQEGVIRRDSVTKDLRDDGKISEET
jgi:predicted ABC-type ATPase